ncbi:hypothetical protein ABK040_002949 [Willaertia magna]
MSKKITTPYKIHKTPFALHDPITEPPKTKKGVHTPSKIADNSKNLNPLSPSVEGKRLKKLIAQPHSPATLMEKPNRKAKVSQGANDNTRAGASTALQDKTTCVKKQIKPSTSTSDKEYTFLIDKKGKGKKLEEDALGSSSEFLNARNIRLKTFEFKEETKEAETIFDRKKRVQGGPITHISQGTVSAPSSPRLSIKPSPKPRDHTDVITYQYGEGICPKPVAKGSIDYSEIRNERKNYEKSIKDVLSSQYEENRKLHNYLKEKRGTSNQVFSFDNNKT